MKNKLLVFLSCTVLAFACSAPTKKQEDAISSNKIDALFENYYQERMQLFPLEATLNGDNRYNNLLTCDVCDGFRKDLKNFYQKYLDSLAAYNRTDLSASQQISYDVLKREMEISLEGLQFNDNYQPIQQFWGIPLTMGQLGSGTGSQPFKTKKDYRDFLGRIDAFATWCDSAIVYMRKGMATGEVYPKILMERVLPQMKSMVVSDPKQSVFYGPINLIPNEFTAEEKAEFTTNYENAIRTKINPSYQKLHDFIQKEYLPKCRETHGISAIPNGKERYAYLIKQWTTTDMSADEVFDLGMSEVTRIRNEMEKVRQATGFKGDLKAFFNYINTDKKFFPFTTAEEVLQAYRDVETRMHDSLTKLFGITPKSKFEVRETEKFREASASAEYSNAAPDGSRPGIFYVPIVNPAKCNNFGMESLFLHEAIPGHHYQTSLQAENTDLPTFRRFIWYGAYGEGWALYTESLGKELGLYKDPYQYFGSLSKEMHRAIRLVVDAGIHSKGWTREQAIQFSLENEPGDEKGIATEVERYMAIPGQALSYKVGQLKILALRKEAEKALGTKFKLSKFHDEVLSDGCLPISVLESKMRNWINAQKDEAMLNDSYGIPAFYYTVQ